VITSPTLAGSAGAALSARARCFRRDDGGTSAILSPRDRGLPRGSLLFPL